MNSTDCLDHAPCTYIDIHRVSPTVQHHKIPPCYRHHHHLKDCLYYVPCQCGPSSKIYWPPASLPPSSIDSGCLQFTLTSLVGWLVVQDYQIVIKICDNFSKDLDGGSQIFFAFTRVAKPKQVARLKKPICVFKPFQKGLP